MNFEHGRIMDVQEDERGYYIPQYEEDTGGLWLRNFLSNLNSSTSGTEVKENKSKKPDTEIMKIGCASIAKPKKIECVGAAKPTKINVKKDKSPDTELRESESKKTDTEIMKPTTPKKKKAEKIIVKTSENNKQPQNHDNSLCDTPQYEDFNEELFLRSIYPNITSTSLTKLNTNKRKESNSEVNVIKPKKTDTEPKKIKTTNVDVQTSPNIKSPPKQDNWLGYIIAVFINETITQSIECCPGCKDSKNSPLFHSHYHSGLLEKLYMFAPSVRTILISKLSVLVADYISKYPDSEIYNDAGRRVLTNIGRKFIRQCNPTFVYYSKYLTPSVDEIVTTTPILKTQPTTLKRVANAAQKGSDSSKRIKTQ